LREEAPSLPLVARLDNETAIIAAAVTTGRCWKISERRGKG